jgi:hypothetical protein
VREDDVLHGTIGKRNAHGTVTATYTGVEKCGTLTIHWIARAGPEAPPGRDAASSIAGGYYQGKTPQGYGLWISVEKAGKRSDQLSLERVDLDCTDGSSDHLTALGFVDVPVKPDGSFTFHWIYEYDPDSTEIEITGILSATNAHGVLSVTYKHDGKTCESGDLSFQIARR